MIKTLNIVSAILLISLVLLIVSQKFYPISELEIFYEKKFYIAFAYIILRFVRVIFLKKQQQNGNLSE